MKVLTSEEVLTVVAGSSDDLIVNRYTGDHLSEDSVSKALELGEWGDVLVVGPGLSEPDPEAVRQIVRDTSVPLVVDADAVEPALDVELSRAVFTPNGEESVKIEEAYGSLAAFAEETGAVVVSTGSSDEIHASGERWSNDAGSSEMAVGGTGDVMAGVIASILGQGFDRVEAARLGTWVVGAVGERAAEEYSIGLTATDVVERFPELLAEHRDEAATERVRRGLRTRLSASGGGSAGPRRSVERDQVEVALADDRSQILGPGGELRGSVRVGAGHETHALPLQHVEELGVGVDRAEVAEDPTGVHLGDSS